MSSSDNGKNIISSLNPTLLYLQYLLHNARFAVVAQDGTGNYTTIQAAVAAGEKTIFVKAGTYSITSDIVLSGQSLISLAPGEAILSMTDATIELETHTATTAYKTGTCTLTNNSTTVTGILTAWDTGANCPSTYTNPWLIGQGMALKVASIQNDSSLLLEDQYRGNTQTINYFLIDAKNIGSEISNFEIIHEPTAPRACIKVSGINCKVRNNLIRADRVNTSYAVYGGASATSVVHSAIIEENIINSGTNGVCLKNAHSCVVRSNIMQNQTSPVFSTNTDDGDCLFNIFSENVITAGSHYAFLLDTGSHYTTISKNKVSNHRNVGVEIAASHYCVITENTFNCAVMAIECTGLVKSDYLIFSNNFCTIGIDDFRGDYATFSSNHFYTAIAGGRTVSLTGNGISFSNNKLGTLYLTGDYAVINNNFSDEPWNASYELTGAYGTVTGNTCYKGVDYGIALKGTGYHTCVGNTIYDPTGNGIYVHAPYCTVQANTIRGGGVAGWAAISVDTVHNIITGNSISAHAGPGISITSASNVCSQNNITSPTENGIEVSGNEIVVSSNSITTGAANGIYCTGSRCKVSGNHCQGSTAASGILMETGDQNIVNGNGCDSNTTYGIFIANTSDRIIITDNICLNNTTAQITNNGTNTVQADNIVA